MDYGKSTETRIDITGSDGSARFTARLFEGIVTIGLSGTRATPSALSIPHEDLPALAEFLEHVLTEVGTATPPDPNEPVISTATATEA